MPLVPSTPAKATGWVPVSQDAAGYSNQAVNMFNNHFFPGIVEDHFTFGGGIALNKNMTLEGAVVYAGQVSKTIDTGTISSYMGTGTFTAYPVNGTCEWHNPEDHSFAGRLHDLPAHELLIRVRGVPNEANGIRGNVYGAACVCLLPRFHVPTTEFGWGAFRNESNEKTVSRHYAAGSGGWRAG